MPSTQPTRPPAPRGGAWQRLLALSQGEHAEIDHAWAAEELNLWRRLAPLAGRREWTAAHLAQSLDGRIAMRCGASRWISGPQDLEHTHQLRALSDAVLVGAATACLDNPRLTVRHVSGPQPLRVVLDPTARTPADHALLKDDAAPTLWVVGSEARCERELAPHVQLLRAPTQGHIAPAWLIQVLRQQGHRRLFVEGGGRTVSHFLQAGALDRLHIVVAPLLLGAGTPSIALEPLAQLSMALRPPTRVSALGQDMLYDMDLS